MYDVNQLQTDGLSPLSDSFTQKLRDECAIDINVDYVSVGKDSIAGLIMLCMCLYILPEDMNWGVYAERYKQLMDGYTVEEIAKFKGKCSD